MAIRIPDEPRDSAFYLKGYYDGRIDYEAKHGKWEKNSDTPFFWRCSECGAYLFWRKEDYLLRDTDELNYCPNCGADMRGEEDD